MNLKRVSLFSFKFGLIIAILLSLLLFIIYQVSKVTVADKEEYKNLVIQAESSLTSSSESTYSSNQQRQKIRKDLLFHKENDRLHMQLFAKKAELVLDKQESKSKLIEKLHNVRCLMQEEIYYLLPDQSKAFLQKDGQVAVLKDDEKLYVDPTSLKKMQIIRVLEADNALYYYNGDHFVADEVKIYRYLVPGHTLEDFNQQSELLMKGKALKVEFSLKSSSKDFDFKAHQLKASFFNLEGVS